MILNKDSKITISDTNLRISIYNAFDGRCFYTGMNIGFNEMHIDHIKPKSKGGKDCISNYVLSSGYINLKKSNRVSYDLIKISTEIVSLLFVDKVIYYYNELTLNDKIISDHIEVNHFLNTCLKNKSHKESFRNYVRLHLVPIKTYKSYLYDSKIKKATKPKIYYNTIKISNLYEKWCS